MKKFLFASLNVAMIAISSCGTTTDKEPESAAYKAPDSAVGNSDAANTIYRDSSNINNATTSGGGTENPAASDSTARGNQR
jgi:hypothetical protein